MKLNSHYDGRDAALRRLVGAARRPYQQAIALVITLIMISVIAFMAITFLVLSQRERGSVSVIASQTDARLAAETALQTATAKLLAPVIAYTNPFNYDLLVSTNYINPAGFVSSGPAFTNYMNVNYDYLNGGGVLNNAQQMQNIANLLYDPRPPVFITNRTTASSDFRFFLNLNRNFRSGTNMYEPSGFLPAIGPSGGFLHPDGTEDNNPANAMTNQVVGDPEWIGILERPELPHSSSNKFIARYAYIAVPASKTLDLNYIHNYAKRGAVNMPFSTDDGFSRNQGVGSWEINLASFFSDLNINAWPTNAYSYINGIGSGFIFDDALAFLRYRYNYAYTSLTNPVPLVDNGGIDEYANGGTSGALMTGTSWNNDFNDTGSGYPGGDNPSHFFTTQDLFDSTKSSAQFVGRMTNAGVQVSSYDRYTFSRLLSQMGTDSAAEQGKINLNYRNVSNGVVVPNLETNFYAWTPIEFFTNVADRLLLNLTNEVEFAREFRSYPVRITNIVIWTSTNNSYNDYTPAVHRVLQLAANIYDATTNRYPLSSNLCAPTVYRPLFQKTATSIIITNYEEVSDAASIVGATLRDLNNAADMAAAWSPSDMVYNIPLVIGAKRGFPSFNALAMQTAVRVTRKLSLTRAKTNETPNDIRQMYVLGISNIFCVAGWNSYSNRYPLGLQIAALADVTTIVSGSDTNKNPPPILIYTSSGSLVGSASNYTHLAYSNTLTGGQWAGFDNDFPTASFTMPLTNFFWSLTNCSWQSTPPGFVFPSASLYNADDLTAPHWWVKVNARLNFFLVDTSVSPQRILDYVNLSSDAATLNIPQELMHGGDCDANPSDNGSAGGAWCTNKPPTYPSYKTVPNFGILNQIKASQGQLSLGVWKNYIDDPSSGNDVQKATNKFLAFMGPMFGGTNLTAQAPFSPFRTIYQYVSWQVNDPLVHYMAQDLTDLLGVPNSLVYSDNNLLPPGSPVASIRAVKPHYRPWGGNPTKFGTDTDPWPTAYHLELKDPLVKSSDNWDFPTNKLPNIGWLGRVHRGTPWQTVYMKSTVADTNTWQKWTGNTDKYDSALAQPEKDWRIFDLFTTAPNANATRGQLPVNQTNLAAWSAALSGVIVLDTNGNPQAIQPAGVSPELQTIVNGINSWRTNAGFSGITNNGLGWFANVGGVLAVPELTVNSPYLGSTAGNNISTSGNTNITDAGVERIPQQTMSLLRLGDQPRFVIYAYGQSLKPADRSIVQAAPYTGLCANYQITGESAIRAVVRVEGVSVNDPKPFRPRLVVESYNNLPPD